MIVDIYKDCLTRLQNEKLAQINIVTEQSIREKVVPHNQDIELKKANAIKEKTEQYNKAIAELKLKLDSDIKKINSDVETDKANFRETTIATDTAITSAYYDTQIQKVQSLIEQLEK